MSTDLEYVLFNRFAVASEGKKGRVGLEDSIKALVKELSTLMGGYFRVWHTKLSRRCMVSYLARWRPLEINEL
jgi:hypothetical protein